jgi:hypothetical protein
MIFQSIMLSVAKEMENWPLYSDRFACKLHRLADKAADFIIKDLERNDDDLMSSSTEIFGGQCRDCDGLILINIQGTHCSAMRWLGLRNDPEWYEKS